MLPQELRTRQKSRDHAQILDMANYIQQTASGTLFMGENLKPFIATLTKLAEQAQRFNEQYAQDHMVPEEPTIQSLSGWKGQQLVEQTN